MCLVWNLTETPCKETACHGTFLWLLVTQVCGQVSAEASPGYSLLLEVLLCRHEYMNAHLFTPPLPVDLCLEFSLPSPTIPIFATAFISL